MVRPPPPREPNPRAGRAGPNNHPPTAPARPPGLTLSVRFAASVRPPVNSASFANRNGVSFAPLMPAASAASFAVCIASASSSAGIASTSDSGFARIAPPPPSSTCAANTFAASAGVSTRTVTGNDPPRE